MCPAMCSMITGARAVLGCEVPESTGLGDGVAESDDLSASLDRLISMRDSGDLTEAEFVAAKAQLLGPNEAPRRASRRGRSTKIVAATAVAVLLLGVTAMAVQARSGTDAQLLSSDKDCEEAAFEFEGVPDDVEPALRDMGCGPWLDGGSLDEDAPSPKPSPSRVSPTPRPSATAATVAPTPSPEPVDPDRPPGALDLGSAVALDGISVSVSEFRQVTPLEPSSSFTHYGAKISFTNQTDGPKEVVPDAQVRLENPYVAEVGALGVAIKEGDAAPWGAFRPSTTVSGWVVFAIPNGQSLQGFGVYYIDRAGNEAVWWPGIQ